MNYADIKKTDVSNGTGIRVSLFVSGCRHRCKGCFNEDAWNFNYGEYYDNHAKEYIIYLLKRPYIRGLSLLGGEPLEPENQRDVLELILEVKKRVRKKDIWLYTGYKYEHLIRDMNTPYIHDILNNIDVLVDGKFEIDRLDLKLKFRGSSNQRIIDMNRTFGDNIYILSDQEV